MIQFSVEKKELFMSDFVPYSEKQKILTTDQWEQMGFLDPDCQTSRVAAEIMRNVVLRLLKIDKSGKNFDINDFEFLVYDDNEPNAGFISSYKTQNHKNIITISTGITKLCKNENEFASILAHELGHFTYAKIYGDNKNTVFQERFADLHALDLMIAGGYDPVAYSRVCDEMRQSGGGSSLFDVHGSNMARKEDVDAYLTKLHKDRGAFGSMSDTGLYNNFAKVINSHSDKYKSYFRQILEHQFPKLLTDSNYVPPISQVFDLILSEMKDGRLNNSQRVDDMLEYIEKYKPTRKREIQSTQHFLEQLVALYNQNATISEHLYKHQIIDLAKTLRLKFRDNKPFKTFYPITEDLAKIDEFMTTRDPERVKQLAFNLYYNDNRIFSIDEIKENFGQPAGFKMPARTLAKGHKMPTDWLWSVSRGMDYETKAVIYYVIQYIGVDCKYDWLTDEEISEKNTFGEKYAGKILATTEHEIEKLKSRCRRQESYKEKHKQFEDFIYSINLLYDFDQGKISATDVVNRLAQYGNQRGGTKYAIDSVTYWISYPIQLIDYKRENKFLKSELQELNSNEAFVQLYIKPFLRTLKAAVQTVSPQSAANIHLDNPPQGKTWFEYLQDVSQRYLKLRKDVEIYMSQDLQINGKLFDVLDQFGRKLGIQDADDAVWNVATGPLVRHISGVHTDVLHQLFVKFVHDAEIQGAYSEHDAAQMLYRYLLAYKSDSAGRWNDFSENKIIRAVSGLEKQTERKLINNMIEHYSVYADSDQWVSNNHVEIVEALDKEIHEKNDLHKVRRLLTAFNMLPTDEQDLIKILSKPTPRNSIETLHQLETMLKEYVLTYYMRKNPPIKNLYAVLYAVHTDIDANFRDNFSDELDDYIEKNNLMPTDFRDIYNLHAVMQRVNVFSKEKSNHSKMLNSLIAHIEKMPPQAREEYSWKLLSGFYYSDDDSRCDMNRRSDDIGNPLARNKLLEIYADTIAQRFGRDDNSDEYFEKIQKLSEFINQEHSDARYPGSTRQAIKKTTQGKLYRLISDKIQSQERVSKFMAEDKNVVLSDADAQSNDLLGRGVETLLDELARHKELSVYSIEFLNQKLTSKSIEDYRKKCAEYSEYQFVGKMIKPSILENFYNVFWSSGLEVRAIIMNKLLNRGFETLDEKIKYVCDMNFGKDNKYRADAEMICDCVIKSFEPYEQDLILAAIASADENKQEGKNASRSVGDGLRMFFENMGPAWVKFGQLLSYVPDLPSEIRHDLGKLKDRADMPARWDVYNWLRETLPNDLYQSIERVEDIVGAGSFWMTAVVQFKNEQGKPEKKVIQLLRSYADARADSGFKTIEKAIDKLSKRNASYKILRNVAYQAHESAKYEVDADIGNKQYEKAKTLYGDITVNIDGTQYTPRVADWRYYGAGYKIMDYAPGATLSRINVSDDERRKMALAYFTIEMVNLFKGDVWDIDRHQGQQNFDITSPNSVDINIYDTGAQLPKAPDNKNKVLLANIFFGLMQSVQSGKSIDSYLLQTIKRLDKLQNKLNIDVSYVSNVQKGLMALSDIMEYQKEIKDADGNIIQERKTLSADDLKYAIMSVLQNPSVDKYISAVIKGRAVASKLVRLQIKQLKELAHSAEFSDDNPVKIIISTKESSSKSHRIMKASEEITASDNPDDSVLGIPKKHIKPQEINSSIIFDEPQKVA